MRISVLIEEDGRDSPRSAPRTDRQRLVRPTYANSASFVALPVAPTKVETLLIQGEDTLSVKWRWHRGRPPRRVIPRGRGDAYGTTVRRTALDCEVTGLTAGVKAAVRSVTLHPKGPKITRSDDGDRLLSEALDRP
jgi:hypothetical protein